MKNPFKRKKKEQHIRKASNSSEMRLNSNVSPNKPRRKSIEVANKRAQTKFKRNFIRYTIIGLIMVIAGLVAWSNSRINQVIMTSPQEEYLETVEQYLNRNPIANLKPLVSTGAIANNLRGAFPEIASVSITVPLLGNKIEVEVTTREDQLVLKTGETDYFVVDQEGFAYARYDTDKGLEGVLILVDDTDVKYGSDASGQFVAPALVSFIQSVNKGLSELESYKDQTFNFRITDEPRIVYVKPSKLGYEIKLQQDISVEQQIDNLSSALKYLNSKNVTPQKYIDIRVNGTVYYK